MSTTQDPDFAGIAERETAKAHPFYTDSDLRVSADALELSNRIVVIRRKVYASCMEARLRSDWETIRLLRFLPHAFHCDLRFDPEVERVAPQCTCGLSAHLSKLLEPFT